MEYYDLDRLPRLGPEDARSRGSPPKARPLDRFLTFLLAFLLLFAAWILLSGRFDLFHLSLGLISCAFVAFHSRDLLFASGRLRGGFLLPFRFTAYIPWLMWQITLANLHVLRLAFSPGLSDKLDPSFIKLRTRLKSDLSIVTLANSITLTPGTITLYTSIDGEVRIHALDKVAGDKGSLRRMEARIARAFDEV